MGVGGSGRSSWIVGVVVIKGICGDDEPSVPGGSSVLAGRCSGGADDGELIGSSGSGKFILGSVLEGDFDLPCLAGAGSGDLNPSVTKSLSTVIREGTGYTGIYFLRNFLLRSVTRPEPSTLTTYWSNWRTSITSPVLSHFNGCGPTWFWTRT